MRFGLPISLMSMAGAAALAFAAVAAPADDFKAWYAKAEAASKLSAAIKAQWTSTVTTLNAAQDAAKAGRYDDAIVLAKQAWALAEASISQAALQHALWKDAVIR
jgi:hypothetical protein